MRLTTLCFSSAVYAAAYTLASDIQPAAATSPSLSNESSPEPSVMSAEEYAVLDARQAAHNPDATQGGSQFPTVTTDWRPTKLPNGQITYWEDAYTQTFAEVPGQLPSPGSGSIGMGTLTKHDKRAVEAQPTGSVATVIAQPVVMIIQSTIVVQPVQRVTEVQIIETVLEYPSSTMAMNATAATASLFLPGSGIPYGTGTAPFRTNATFSGTGISGMPNSSTNGTRGFLFGRFS
ncbi:hypothetical protein Q7P37_001603 [Cladosporium fusiforme]